MTRGSADARRSDPISVVIPAHNEAAVIGRCLDGLLGDARPGEIEVIVACNGCLDDTATIARGYGPMVRVVETDTASKSLALDQGEAQASGFPRVFLDADVEMDTNALRRVAAVLERGPALVAAPRPRLQLGGRPWVVRAYYRTWSSLPYAREGLAGSGVYAVSRAGRARFGRFGGIWADDQFVCSQFSRGERESVHGVSSTVHPPRTLGDLVAVRTRKQMFNTIDRRHFGRGHDGLRRKQRLALGRLALDPRRWVDVGVFVGVNVTAKVLARRRIARAGIPSWSRDDSSRAVEGS